MLFDLIKCHALLFIHQRKRDEKGSLVATQDDFTYARQLFLSITSEAGGQETKQTRNESAALETIAKMSVEYFTIKQLQDALGLSYHQTYRLLHGYSNSRASYTGILDKCPAISFIDATVAEELYGVSLKRREHYFSFDFELYRSWSAKAQIWLDEEENTRNELGHDNNGDDSESTNFSPGFQHNQGKSASEQETESSLQFFNQERSREMHIQDHVSLHTIPEAHSADECNTHEPACSCIHPHDANDHGMPQHEPQWKNQWQESLPEKCTQECEPVQFPAKIPQRQGKVTPISGLLDHREFARTTVQLGRCDICDKAAAAYRCIEKQVNICNGCYARLMRGWNQKNGIR